MNPKSCVLIVCATAGALSASCTATHFIDIASNPRGADIVVIRNPQGTEEWRAQTSEEQPQVVYALISPWKEKMWPWAVTIEARMEGRLTDRKEYKVRDPLPERVEFVLHPSTDRRPSPTQPGDDGDLPDKYDGPAADPSST